ncbi:MAG TPA: histidinol-phosphate transaminase [bacterium]|nr:histidinol-phosphate transaminase [bacterium]
MTVKVAPYIQKITPYRPGKPISEVERELGIYDTVKMASNENPLGPSPKVTEAIRADLPYIHLYPDGNAFYLKHAIMRHLARHHVKMDELLIGNGSNEVIDVLLRALCTPEEELLVSAQAFMVYELIAKAANIPTVLVPLAKDHRFDIPGYIERINEKTKLIALVNPNNPTGTYYTKKEFEALLSYVPERCVVLVDEAYYEYVDAPDCPNAMEYRKDFENLVICRTFSKAFGLSGLRLGYGVTTAEIGDTYRKVRAPFNVNELAQVAGVAALEDTDYLRRSIETNRKGKEYFYAELRRMELEFLPSQGNFLLVRVGGGETGGAECYENLLREGIIIRPVNNYGFPDWIRISIGLPEQNQRCIAALEAYLRNEGRVR